MCGPLYFPACLDAGFPQLACVPEKGPAFTHGLAPERLVQALALVTTDTTDTTGHVEKWLMRGITACFKCLSAKLFLESGKHIVPGCLLPCVEALLKIWFRHWPDDNHEDHDKDQLEKIFKGFIERIYKGGSLSQTWGELAPQKQDKIVKCFCDHLDDALVVVLEQVGVFCLQGVKLPGQGDSHPADIAGWLDDVRAGRCEMTSYWDDRFDRETRGTVADWVSGESPECQAVKRWQWENLYDTELVERDLRSLIPEGMVALLPKTKKCLELFAPLPPPQRGD